LEIYVVPIGHGFSFFDHGKVLEKSRKISVEKEGAPWWYCAFFEQRRYFKRLLFQSTLAVIYYNLAACYWRSYIFTVSHIELPTHIQTL